jgi:hypothetical protein
MVLELRRASATVGACVDGPYPSTHVMELYTRNLDGSGPAHGDSSVSVRFSASTPVLHAANGLGEMGKGGSDMGHVGGSRPVADDASGQSHRATPLTRARIPPH